jgi:hypothetical protein
VYGRCTVGTVVAGTACCATCPNHPKRDPWGSPVRVPEPPPVEASGRLAVVTCAAGREGKDLLAVSGPWLRAYAARLGAEFVVLDWPGVKGWGQSAKFQFGRVLENFDRAAFVDADTVADPARAPDLFAETPAGSVGIYDDLPGLLRYKEGGNLVEEYQRLRGAVGLLRSHVRFYGNTGVVVADRAHAGIFSGPEGPIPPVHCGEQHLWVARLHDSGTPVHLLPARCNYQWWEHDEFREAPPADAILHFSGIRPMKSAGARLEVMRRHASRSANQVTGPA